MNCYVTSVVFVSCFMLGLLCGPVSTEAISQNEIYIDQGHVFL